jgi:hypothetical protein
MGHDCLVGSAGQAPDDRRLANGEWMKGPDGHALRERLGGTSNPQAGSRVPRGQPAASSLSPVPYLSKLRLVLVNPMHIEPLGSNRIARPLGTGRSPMHGSSQTGSWRRSANGPQGTAQGNRGSAMQGGTPALSGSLPFQSSGHRRTIVGTAKVHPAAWSPLTRSSVASCSLSPHLT